MAFTKEDIRQLGEIIGAAVKENRPAEKEVRVLDVNTREYVKKAQASVDISGELKQLITKAGNSLDEILQAEKERSETILINLQKEILKKQEALKDTNISDEKRAKILNDIDRQSKNLEKQFKAAEESLAETQKNTQENILSGIKSGFKTLGESKFTGELSQGKSVDDALQTYKDTLYEQIDLLEKDKAERERLGIADEDILKIKEDLRTSYLAELESQSKSLSLDEETRKNISKKLKREKINLGQATYEETYGRTDLGKLVGRLSDITKKRQQQETKGSSEFTKYTNVLLGAFFGGSKTQQDFLKTAPKGISAADVSKLKPEQQIITPTETEELAKRELKLESETKIEKEAAEKKKEEKDEEKELKKQVYIMTSFFNNIIDKINGKSPEKETKKKKSKTKTETTAVIESKPLPGTVEKVTQTDVSKQEKAAQKIESDNVIEALNTNQQILEEAKENVPFKMVLADIDTIAEKKLEQVFNDVITTTLLPVFKEGQSEKQEKKKKKEGKKEEKKEESSILSDTKDLIDTAKKVKRGAKRIKKGAKAAKAARAAAKAARAARVASTAATVAEGAGLLGGAGAAGAGAAGAGAAGAAGAGAAGAGAAGAGAAGAGAAGAGAAGAGAAGAGLTAGTLALGAGAVLGTAAVGLGIGYGLGSTELGLKAGTGVLNAVGYNDKTEAVEKDQEEFNKEIEKSKQITDPTEKRIAYFEAQLSSLNRQSKIQTGEEKENTEETIKKIEKRIEKLKSEKIEKNKTPEQKIEKPTEKTGENIKIASKTEAPAVEMAVGEGTVLASKTEAPAVEMAVGEGTVLASKTEAPAVEKAITAGVSSIPQIMPTAEKSVDVSPLLEQNNKETSYSNILLKQILEATSGKSTGSPPIIPMMVQQAAPQPQSSQTESSAHVYRAQHRVY
jgi:hypothetical protein